jgi:hypothetical protein
MPRRELKSGKQVADWLAELGSQLKQPGNLTLIGSEFERTHGWHVNLMPPTVLDGLPAGWEQRTAKKQIGRLNLIVPAPADLLAPKLKRNEPRDRVHADWAQRMGLLG